VNITSKNLPKLFTVYKGYLKGDKLDGFFEEFGIRFAAGHWCAGDFADRFAPVGYNSNNKAFRSDILSQIERVARTGIKGIEFHEAVFLDAKGQKDSRMIKAVRQALRAHKLVPTNMNNNLWTDPKWKLGSVCNPDRRIRRDALAVALQSAELAKEVGCSSVALWPGADGWDYNFETNYGRLNDLYIEACIEINKKCKKLGLKFGTEAKLHEPREGNMVVSTSAKAILVAQAVNRACGGRNMGICIDYGHEQMYGNEPADSVYCTKVFGVPMVNFHVNNAKLHSNDEDRCAGTGDNWRLADFCYAAIDIGYNGWFGEDQFTYRMEPVKAMSLSREMFGNIMKKALMIYARRAQLAKAQATGDAGKTIDVVKEILIGA
jgi:xylose isomerase